MRRRAGFALIEVLLSMMVLTAMIPITVLCIQPFGSMLQFDQEIQDQIALSQLRRILMLSYNVSCRSDEIDFVYQQQPRCVSLVNDHLVLSPGTQIFMTEIDHVTFLEEGKFIYIVYMRNQKEYEKILTEKY